MQVRLTLWMITPPNAPADRVAHLPLQLNHISSSILGSGPLPCTPVCSSSSVFTTDALPLAQTRLRLTTGLRTSPDPSQPT